MLNFFIQGLTVASGLLVNFSIPVIFGLEQYGLFLKANILVFLFHKLSDLVGEPLIAMVEKNAVMPISLLLNFFIFIIFILMSRIFSLGDPRLLVSMLWSNSILLTMYSHQKLNFICFYLSLFVFIFFLFIGLSHIDFGDITIADTLIAVNIIPSTIFFLLLLINEKKLLDMENTFLYVTKITTIVPSLFFVSLINNMFSNIVPYYLSFVFSPTMLGLYRVQVSLAQSVAALFPLNTKIIIAKLMNRDRDVFFRSLLKVSFSYFYLLIMLGLFFVVILGNKLQYTQILLLMPIIHITIVFEKYLLVIRKKKFMAFVNITISLFLLLMIHTIHTIFAMNLLYFASMSFYLFLMVFVGSVEHIKLILFFIFLTLMTILVSTYSIWTSFIIQIFLVVFVWSDRTLLGNWKLIR